MSTKIIQRRKAKPWRVTWIEAYIHEGMGIGLAVLKVRSPSGTKKQVSIPPSDLLNPRLAANKVIDQLVDPRDAEGLQKVLAGLAEEGPRKTIKLTRRSGYSSGLFVMPSRVLQLEQGVLNSLCFDPDMAARNRALEAVGQFDGTLAGWKKQVARPCGLSSIAMTAIAAAFAAPLLRYSKLTESFWLNIAGRSASGKTIANLAAMSVQGAADRGALVPPSLSPRSLEQIGVGLNDLLFPLDDLARIQGLKRRDLVEWLAYHFSDGGGRVVADAAMKDGLPLERFKSVGIMSNEKTSQEIAKDAGQSLQLGEQARFFDLIVDPDTGIFDQIPVGETRSPKQLAIAIEDAARSHYGVALPAFLMHIAAMDRSALEARIAELTGTFVGALDLKGDPVAMRGADKFGLLYAGLILAREAKIVPWAPKAILAAVRKRFAVARQGAVASIPRTGMQLVQRLQEFLREPGVVMTVKKGKHCEGKRGGWGAVQGLQLKGQPLLGIREEWLKQRFPDREERDQLLAKLSALGILDLKEGQKRWLAVLPNESKDKVRLLECDMRLLN